MDEPRHVAMWLAARVLFFTPDMRHGGVVLLLVLCACDASWVQMAA